MFIVINAFLLGAASGLCALIGLAFLSWAARLGYVHLGHTGSPFQASHSLLTSSRLMAIIR